ncbi:hypothetical protein K0A96_03025 [Patescibacteria group bacterium]|nr:hypothetical protein [Patescibacteria group bacterium]
MGTSAFLIGVLLASAVLLAVSGWKTFRSEATDSKVWVLVAAVFFTSGLIYLAFQLAMSPLP